jgi:hypothetical protein
VTPGQVLVHKASIAPCPRLGVPDRPQEVVPEHVRPRDLGMEVRLPLAKGWSLGEWIQCWVRRSQAFGTCTGQSRPTGRAG